MTCCRKRQLSQRLVEANDAVDEAEAQAAADREALQEAQEALAACSADAERARPQLERASGALRRLRCASVATALTADGLLRPRLSHGTSSPFTDAMRRLHGRGLCLPLCMLAAVEQPDVNAALSAFLGADRMARCWCVATELGEAERLDGWRQLLCPQRPDAWEGFAAAAARENPTLHPQQRLLELPPDLSAQLEAAGIDLEAPGSGFVGAAVNLLHVPPQLLSQHDVVLPPGAHPALIFPIINSWFNRQYEPPIAWARAGQHGSCTSQR